MQMQKEKKMSPHGHIKYGLEKKALFENLPKSPFVHFMERIYC